MSRKRKDGFGPPRRGELDGRPRKINDRSVEPWLVGGGVVVVLLALAMAGLQDQVSSLEGRLVATGTPGVCAEGSNFTDFYLLEGDLPMVVAPGLRGLENVRVMVDEEGVYVTDNLGTNFHPYVEGERMVRIDNPWGRQEITAYEQVNAVGQEGVNVVSECIPAFSGSPESR